MVDATPVITTDIFRTVTKLARATVPDDGIAPDGMDLMPLLRGADDASSRDLFWAGRICKPKGCVDSGALRNGRWKILIEDGGKPQFFDFSNDPGEARDLAVSQPALTSAMTGRYKIWKAKLPTNAASTAPIRNGRLQSDDNE